MIDDVVVRSVKFGVETVVVVCLVVLDVGLVSVLFGVVVVKEGVSVGDLVVVVVVEIFVVKVVVGVDVVVVVTLVVNVVVSLVAQDAYVPNLIVEVTFVIVANGLDQLLCAFLISAFHFSIKS